MIFVLAILNLCLYALTNLMSFFSCLTFVTVGSGDYKMRGLAGVTIYKVQGLLLAMVHKKNNSHSMFMRPHKPHIIPFLSYLNQLPHF